MLSRLISKMMVYDSAILSMIWWAIGYPSIISSTRRPSWISKAVWDMIDLLFSVIVGSVILALVRYAFGLKGVLEINVCC